MTIHHRKSVKTEASTIDEAVDLILNSRKKRLTWQDNVGPEGKLKGGLKNESYSRVGR